MATGGFYARCRSCCWPVSCRQTHSRRLIRTRSGTNARRSLCPTSPGRERRTRCSSAATASRTLASSSWCSCTRRPTCSASTGRTATHSSSSCSTSSCSSAAPTCSSRGPTTPWRRRASRRSRRWWRSRCSCTAARSGTCPSTSCSSVCVNTCCTPIPRRYKATWTASHAIAMPRKPPRRRPRSTLSRSSEPRWNNSSNWRTSSISRCATLW
mmetsp:Transcript_7503/g.14614  ORF Transcript_7503/g.14614 Transcript_7503/m.14614 type:complete len:212 (+) Transcript_7503:3667-4302(+)